MGFRIEIMVLVCFCRWLEIMYLYTDIIYHAQYEILEYTFLKIVGREVL